MRTSWSTSARTRRSWPRLVTACPDLVRHVRPGGNDSGALPSSTRLQVADVSTRSTRLRGARGLSGVALRLYRSGGVSRPHLRHPGRTPQGLSALPFGGNAESLGSAAMGYYPGFPAGRGPAAGCGRCGGNRSDFQPADAAEPLLHYRDSARCDPRRRHGERRFRGHILGFRFGDSLA